MHFFYSELGDGRAHDRGNYVTQYGMYICLNIFRILISVMNIDQIPLTQFFKLFYQTLPKCRNVRPAISNRLPHFILTLQGLSG